MTKRYYKYAETHRSVRGRRQKYCTRCKQWKGIGEFRIDRDKRDGLKIRCRDCNKAYEYEYRRKHRGNVREYLRFERRHRRVKGVKQKLCGGCKQWKGEGNFYRNRSSRDGLAFRCIECGREHGRKQCGRNTRGSRRNLRNEERHRVVQGVKQKLCANCNQWKNESDFYRNRKSKDGVGSWCKECHTRDARGRRKGTRKWSRTNLRYEDRHRVVDGIGQKLCTKCGRWKSQSEYYTDRSRKDGLSVWCQKCSYTATKKFQK